MNVNSTVVFKYCDPFNINQWWRFNRTSNPKTGPIGKLFLVSSSNEDLCLTAGMEGIGFGIAKCDLEDDEETMQDHQLVGN